MNSDSIFEFEHEFTAKSCSDYHLSPVDQRDEYDYSCAHLRVTDHKWPLSVPSVFGAQS